MDKTILVSADVASGSKILEALDDSGLDINLAMWVRLPEYDDWRFALSSRRLDNSKPSAYGLVHDALAHAGIPLENTPPLMILGMAEPFVRILRRTFGRANSITGMRIGGQMIGDQFVDDAVLYRIR